MKAEHKQFFKQLADLLLKYNAEIDSYENNHGTHMEISFDYNQENAIKFTANIDYTDCEAVIYK